jgi:hypothetical protein
VSSGLMKGKRVWDELADMLEGRMASHVVNSAHTERWKVLKVSPLVVGQLQGELTLEEGDPDLEITQWVRTYMKSPGLQIGDVVLVLYADEEYSVHDVVSAREVS